MTATWTMLGPSYFKPCASVLLGDMSQCPHDATWRLTADSVNSDHCDACRERIDQNARTQVIGYEARQLVPVVLPPDLAHDLWREIKGMRDEADQRARAYAEHAKVLQGLMDRMKECGANEHLPTIEEVRESIR